MTRLKKIHTELNVHNILHTHPHIWKRVYNFIYLFLHTISYIDIYIFPLYKHKYKCKINHTIIQA